MKPYKPRRQSKRWLNGDCPAGVLAIYDNKGRTADRYTVIYAQPITGTKYSDMWLGLRAMSENPFHPQGVGLYCEYQAHQIAAYRYRERNRACKWSDLPALVRKCVLQDLAPEPEPEPEPENPLPHLLKNAIDTGKITNAAILEAVERRRGSLDNPGFCLLCGAENEGIEPDLRGGPCENCGAPSAVYGVETLLIEIAP